MALFQDCWANRRATLERLQQLLTDAKANEPTEWRAATDIQRLFRGQFVRATIATKRRAEIVLARFYRGHRARRRVQRLRERKRHHQHLCVLHYYATIIQKTLRGVHSRRTRLDMRLRKAYVAAIATKGDEMRRLLAAKLKQQEMEQQQADADAAARELVDVTQSLHHLVSTRAIAGVYNAPRQATGAATAFGVPVETHIRTNARARVVEQLATQLPRIAPLRPLPPSNKATIQASSVYDADTRAARVQRKYSKLRRVGTSDFQTVHNAARSDTTKLQAPTLNVGVEYLDEYANPYKKRGVPRSKDDLLPKLTTLAKAPKTPFHLTHGGNKSKVLPNDRFDV